MNWRGQLRPDQYQTYAIRRPPGTRWRKAECEEVWCGPNRYGWQSVIDEHTDLGRAQAHLIRNRCGRKFIETRHPVLRTTVFTFEAGQRCFHSDEHRIEEEYSPLYVVRGGDRRGNPTGFRRVHSGPDPWLDDFATNQDHLNTAAQRG